MKQNVQRIAYQTVWGNRDAANSRLYAPWILVNAGTIRWSNSWYGDIIHWVVFININSFQLPACKGVK